MTRKYSLLPLLAALAALPALPQSAQSQPAPQVGSEAPAMTAPPGVGRLADPAPAVGNGASAAPMPATPTLSGAAERASGFLADGGPAIWAIAALSVITLAVILWKIWRLVLAGAWSRRASARAVALWEAGDRDAALALVQPRSGMRSRFVAATMRALRQRPKAAAREEATRLARESLEQAGSGLRALELIATIAPLLGLLGTVLGMIDAFRQLQEAGAGADPAQLAGGIWEALLTTAAGMAVAIPASAALTWFEAVIARARHDMESLAARLFIHEDSEIG